LDVGKKRFEIWHLSLLTTFARIRLQVSRWLQIHALFYKALLKIKKYNAIA
jgi:hypothetical protein